MAVKPDEVLRRVYADDSIPSPVDAAQRELPHWKRSSLSVRACILGLTRERKERRTRLGLGPKAIMPAALVRSTVPTVRDDIVLAWRSTRQPGDVRPVMCPNCAEVFAIPADPHAKAKTPCVA